MTAFYLGLAVILLAMAAHGLVARRNLLRKILALNVMTSAVFLLLVTLARLATPVDPIPHAMVLTGIVVAVSTTAVALVLLVRLYRGSGSLSLRDRSRD